MPAGGTEKPFSKEKDKKLKKKRKLIYTKSPIKPGWVEGHSEVSAGYQRYQFPDWPLPALFLGLQLSQLPI